MRSWDLRTKEVEPHEPQILSTADDARTILLVLPSGERLQEHEVHEHARIIVIEGEVEASTPEGGRIVGGVGQLLEFAPGERHSIVARAEARLLLILSPWPGDGHPGAMTLEEKAEVRERAAAHLQSP